MSLDCGKKPGVVAVDGMRRCRVLLSHPSMIILDLRLMSQVEVQYIPNPGFMMNRNLQSQAQLYSGASPREIITSCRYHSRRSRVE